MARSLSVSFRFDPQVTTPPSPGGTASFNYTNNRMDFSKTWYNSNQTRPPFSYTSTMVMSVSGFFKWNENDNGNITGSIASYGTDSFVQTATPGATANWSDTVTIYDHEGRLLASGSGNAASSFSITGMSCCRLYNTETGTFDPIPFSIDYGQTLNIYIGRVHVAAPAASDDFAMWADVSNVASPGMDFIPDARCWDGHQHSLSSNGAMLARCYNGGTHRIVNGVTGSGTATRVWDGNAHDRKKIGEVYQA